MIKLFLLIAAFSLVYGNEVSKIQVATRHVSLVKYYFYSLKNPLVPVPIPADIGKEDDGITTTPDPIDPEDGVTDEEDHPLSIDNGRPTMVIVHGHGGDGFTTLNPMVKNDLLRSEKNDYNVIVVDWGPYTQQSYTVALNAVNNVAVWLAIFLNRCADQRRIDLRTTHLVGFNLGAHVLGIAARKLRTKPARITGLDPSKSQWGSGTVRLSKDDALYVEVIHTDGSGVLANGIGTAIGHVDFFVNGGSNQPGCLTHQCSHNRAYEVFAASLRGTTLTGNLCNSNLQLSLNTCRGSSIADLGGTNLWKLVTHGIYRVNTKKTYPF